MLLQVGIMKFVSHLVNYVASTSIKYGIDSSHSLPHSLDVIRRASDIFYNVKWLYPFVIPQERVILTAAGIHDMCDGKYMNELEGIQNIELFLEDKLEPCEIESIKKIITTMSYSKVKLHGYPYLGNYQMAYHIVREADLLAAYDFERAMLFNIHKQNGDLVSAYENSCELFYSRVLRYSDDNLFVTDYSKILSNKLHDNALIQMDIWKRVITKM